jgi:hypothetical protein
MYMWRDVFYSYEFLLWVEKEVGARELQFIDGLYAEVLFYLASGPIARRGTVLLYFESC